MFAWMIQFLKSRKLLPTISETERIALEAGTVWVEGELFSGRPDFHRILNEAYPSLTAEEKAFLDGPVEEVCNMCRGWDVTRDGDLPEHVWAYLRANKFFGLLVPREYGGLGMGSLAFSAMIGKLGTHSMALNSIVLIPNSIGPAELIWHYGTPEQKDYWLPRLASGQEIPCFALTEPRAGSDAGSMTSTGTLFKRDDGSLAIRLDWEKRYITLAPIGTLLGLAFKLRDPDNLLGKGEDVGITCGLVPTDLPGVEVGRRHDPMGTGFPNGPTRGRGVVVPAENIIGGLACAGRGWQMLMEALAGGRALSLPGGAAAGIKAGARKVGAYAALREQFGMPIGKFEGIQELLARIAGYAYLVEATRVFTCGAVGRGEKPSVVSAIVKYTTTELGRQIANDAMDVLGGKAICRGPRNPIADGYMAAPIAITVEGANILTRTLMVFGQGALRCHPWLYKEVEALEKEDPQAFKKALLGHAFHATRNVFRTSFLGATRAWFASGRPAKGPAKRYVRKFKWASALFATLADLVLVTSGPKLKQKGQLTGRFADALGWMFLGVSTIRRFEAEGRLKEDVPLLDWSLQTCLGKIQEAFEGILKNFQAPVVGWAVRFFGSIAMRTNPIGTGPSDALKVQVANLLLEPGAQRDRLTSGIFESRDERDPARVLETAFQLRSEVQPLAKKVREAIKEGRLPKQRPVELIEAARAAGVLTEAEAELWNRFERLRDEVLRVDEFETERKPHVEPKPAAVHVA